MSLAFALLAAAGSACICASEGGFRLLSGEAALTQSLFNTRKNEHYLCRQCGSDFPTAGRGP